jgi:hypothetical protein
MSDPGFTRTGDSPEANGGKKSGSYELRVLRALGRARKIQRAQAAETGQAETAELLLAEANVLAMLELASAIRGARS